MHVFQSRPNDPRPNRGKLVWNGNVDCLRLSYGHDGGEAEENSVREEENELLSCTQTLQVSVATDTSSQLTFRDSPGNRCNGETRPKRGQSETYRFLETWSDQ